MGCEHFIVGLIVSKVGFLYYLSHLQRMAQEVQNGADAVAFAVVKPWLVVEGKRRRSVLQEGVWR
ncbi:hypothetical protein CASFOL_030276 [Castilleja foliolosa]|uniref:Uncharacterized protein n=1 Tax=Castilleja foliolosa TaxID=1961234 RepID=A0ABD3C835_9LAMI